MSGLVRFLFFLELIIEVIEMKYFSVCFGFIFIFRVRVSLELGDIYRKGCWVNIILGVKVGRMGKSMVLGFRLF